MAKKVLVSGGAGYIGSHVTVELIQAGYEVVVADNMSNCDMTCFEGVKKITGREDIPFYQIDCCDYASVDRLFTEHKIDAVIHFAASKAVGESVEKPLLYYRNNIGSLVVLLELMNKHGVHNIVFSSSCTVYGQPDENHLPVDESAPIQKALSPYGNTKQVNEQILRDTAHANKLLNVILLRYFNPIGAHKSGLIGEDPKGIPNNLMPYISQVAVGKLEKLHVFGNDYNTVDGTGVRDYIHVVDLALGHVKAVDWALANKGCEAFNLGTGNGTSVLQLRDAFVKASGIDVPYVIDPRRPGDPDEVYAQPDKAREMLGWEAKFGIDEMCEDTWRWQSNNPQGYNE